MEIPDRDGHAAEFARDLARLNARQRRELARLMGKPPDLRNVPDQFWREARQEYQDQVAAALFLLLLLSMEEHGLDEHTATAEAARMANARAALLAGDFIDGAQAQLRATPVEGLMEAVERAFGPVRAAFIANNETTWAQTQGGETAIDATVGLSDDDLWQNHPSESKSGPCMTCAPLNATPRKYWARFFPEGPPTPHPGCVCTIVYANVGKSSPFAVAGPS